MLAEKMFFKGSYLFFAYQNSLIPNFEFNVSQGFDSEVSTKIRSCFNNVEFQCDSRLSSASDCHLLLQS